MNFFFFAFPGSYFQHFLFALEIDICYITLLQKQYFQDIKHSDSQHLRCNAFVFLTFKCFFLPIFHKMVNLLLAKGANINAFDKKDRRALHWAAYEGKECFA